MTDNKEDTVTGELTVENYLDGIPILIRSADMDYYEEDRKARELTIRYENSCFADISFSIRRIFYSFINTFSLLPLILKNIKTKDKDIIMENDTKSITREFAEYFIQKDIDKFYKTLEEEGYKLKPIPGREDPKSKLYDFFLARFKKSYLIKD